jgi:SAM-dependent methyltransferase
MSAYTQNFYNLLQEGCQQSAGEIIPIVIELIQPQSVIDIGCGLGTWLSKFQQYNITDILGVDGDYIEPEQLEIPSDKFIPYDLKHPFTIDRKFDLVISLEVAEHLPQDCAEEFVASLTNLGSVVLFSAAIPFQGGTEHINEQWPDYWVSFFEKRDFIPIDCIRRRIWTNEKVEVWYAQNIMVFVDKKVLDLPQYDLLKKELTFSINSKLSVVHPKKYLEVVERHLQSLQEIEKIKAASQPKNMSFKKLLSALPIVFYHGLKRCFIHSR